MFGSTFLYELEVFLFAICHKLTLCEYSDVRPEVLIHHLHAVSNSVTAKTGKFD